MGAGGRACHDPGGAPTLSVTGEESTALVVRPMMPRKNTASSRIERVLAIIGRVGGADDGRGRGGGSIIEAAAGFGAAAFGLGEADVAVDASAAASGPQKN